MGIRDKLLDFKSRLSDRHMYSIVILSIAILSSLGIYQYKAKLNYKNFVENQFNRAFFELVGDVQNVETSLAKSMVTSTPRATATELTEVWRQANFAQNNLSQLPLSNIEIGNTARFISQVGDFSYTVSRDNIDGKSLTNDQWKTLENLHNNALTLENSLVKLEQNIQSGRMQWGELQSKGPVAFKTAAKTLSGEIGDVEKQFKDVPSLIYDGPFSEHIEKLQPTMFVGKKEVTREEAMEVAKNFVGKDKVSQISNPANSNGNIKTYGIMINGPTTPDRSEITVDITKTGGYVLQMINSRMIGAASLNVQQAKDIAKKFLDSKDFTGMKDTYYMSDNNTATINFAYLQNGVVIYPDLIKVKIALDNGEVVGFESRGYLMSHKVRNLPIPKISEKQARTMLNPRLKIISVGLGVIPLESKREVFVYELKGSLGNRNFLSYINADTGRQENTLIILDTPNGTLTM